MTERLPARLFQVQPGAFLFEKRLAGPKQIDGPGTRFVERADAFFITGNRAALAAENLAKFIEKSLSITFFTGNSYSFDGKDDRARPG